jgi:predicted nucleic-acid-binding protein
VAQIGLDTNVAMRWLLTALGDDAQSKLAVDAVEGMADGVHINLVVLAEFMWLVGQKSKLGRAEQVLLVRGLLENPRVSLAEPQAVSEALVAFERGGAGLIDHLIGILNRNAGCTTTLTFDKVAAKTPEFTLLS